MRVRTERESSGAEKAKVRHRCEKYPRNPPWSLEEPRIIRNILVVNPTTLRELRDEATRWRSASLTLVVSEPSYHWTTRHEGTVTDVLEVRATVRPVGVPRLP